MDMVRHDDPAQVSGIQEAIPVLEVLAHDLTEPEFPKPGNSAVGGKRDQVNSIRLRKAATP
jgi:hypothetical protein